MKTFQVSVLIDVDAEDAEQAAGSVIGSLHYMFEVGNDDDALQDFSVQFVRETTEASA